MIKDHIKGYCPVCNSTCYIKTYEAAPSFLLCPACFSGELEYSVKIPKKRLVKGLAVKVIQQATI